MLSYQYTNFKINILCFHLKDSIKIQVSKTKGSVFKLAFFPKKHKFIIPPASYTFEIIQTHLDKQFQNYGKLQFILHQYLRNFFKI